MWTLKNGSPARDPHSWSGSAITEPKYGILSWPLFTTPIIKWIFTARIRSDAKTDVIFVGDKTLKVKAVNPWSGELELANIFSVNDFHAKIIAAAILGERTKSDGYDEFNETKVEQGQNSEHPPQILILLLDSHSWAALTYTEGEQGEWEFSLQFWPLPAVTSMDETSYYLATDARARAIAIAASNHHLVVNGFACSNADQKVHIKDSIKVSLILPLRIKVLKMEFLCPIKEDFDTVILLVLGLDDNKIVIDIYSWNLSELSKPTDIKRTRHPLGKEHGYPTLLIPLKSEISAGYFMLVEEDNMLLYLVSTSGAIQQTACANLRDQSGSKPRTSRWPGVSARMPLWINWARPVRNLHWRHEAIYVGREDGVVKYIQVGPARPTGGKLIFEVIGFAGELDCNIDTAMAALDISQARRPHSDYLNFEKEMISSSVAGFDYFYGYPDALLVASATSDGGLYEIGYSTSSRNFSSLSREEVHQPRRKKTFSNWAPLSAVTVLQSDFPISPEQRKYSEDANHFTANDPRSAHKERIFAVSGDQPYGAITELRYGFKLSLSMPRTLQSPQGSDAYEEKLSLDHCNGLWLVEMIGAPQSLIAFSFPWYSAFTWLDLNNSVVSSNIALSYNGPTLAMSSDSLQKWATSSEGARNRMSVLSQFMICVSPNYVRLLEIKMAGSPPFDGARATAVTEVKRWNIESSTFAVMEPGSNYVVIATPRSEMQLSYQVSLNKVITGAGEPAFRPAGCPIDFHEEISCLAYLGFPQPSSASGFKRSNTTLEETDDKSIDPVLIGIGTLCGVLQIVRIRYEDEILEPIFTYNTLTGNTSFEGSRAIESICLLNKGNKDTFQLLCGTRSGNLQVVHITLVMNRLEDRFETTLLRSCCISVGDLPARIDRGFLDSNSQDAKLISAAVVYSGANIYLLDPSPAFNPDLARIVFDDPGDPGFRHGHIDAMISTGTKSVLKGWWIAVSDGQILAGCLGGDVQSLPHKRRIMGTPTKILYSKQWRSLIIASKVSQVSVADGKRFALSTIFRLDPNTCKEPEVSQEELDRHEAGESAFYCAIGERICDLMECFIHRSGKTYHFLVAITMITGENGREWGRILYFNDKHKLSLIFQTAEPAPVFAICQTKLGSLIYCCGNEVKMRVYDSEKKRWQKFILWNQMPSPGVSISIRETTLSVITELHSIMVFSLDEDALSLRKLYGGIKPYTGISCLDLPQQDLMLMATRDNRVLGLSGATGQNDSGSEPTENQCKQEFEAHLPNKVTKLVRANFRQLRRQCKLPGIEESDIVGTAIDGTVMMFSILTPAAWRFLRFVQTLCTHNPRFGLGYRSTISSRFWFELKEYQASDMWVDGSCIRPLLAMPTPEAELDMMLNSEPSKNGIVSRRGTVRDYEEVAERRAKFEELLTSVINDSMRESMDVDPPQKSERLDFLGPELTESNTVQFAVEYLRNIFGWTPVEM